MYILRLEQQGIYFGEEEIKGVAQVYIRKFGLDKDIFTQYICYLRNIIVGDLGVSFVDFPTPVINLLKQRLPWTIGLLGLSAIIAWIIGNTIGALISWKRKSRISDFLFSFFLIFSQIPYYFVALTLLLILAYTFLLFPRGGAFSPALTPSFDIKFIMDVLYHAFLPSMSIIITSACGWIISMRSLMVPLLNEDYILFAKAKGLKERRIFVRYAIRNALLPQVTGLALSLGFTASGSYIVEAIFNYPGVGKLFIDSLSLMDYNTIQCCILLTMFLVLTASMLIELLYVFIDPRIRYGER